MGNTIADKLAEKTFHSATFQKSWNVHMQAFGPILQPAFENNYQAKVHLCAALNFMSNRNAKKGYDKLQSMEDECITDADKAAWLFFVGLCCEMSGMNDDMLMCYQQAAEFGHHFYLPYLKVAKVAHNDAVFEMAEENYLLAIRCLNEMQADEQMNTILASAYTNLASCLTMMHRYQDAEEMLEESKKVLPQQTGRKATEAILYAAMREDEKVMAALEELKQQIPMVYATTKEMTDKIMGDLHPHFSTMDTDTDKLNDFWKWFTENEDDIKLNLKNENFNVIFEMIQKKLKEVFCFMERDLEMGLEPDANGCKILFSDFYVIALRHGYKELLKVCPEQLKSYWMFEIVH